MKTLPDNPNLDHLRQQAKDLLAGLRDLEPEASLADAQRSLAEQYGFRTWTELKAEVDRRRGRSARGRPGVARAIAERYQLGEVIGAMRSVARADEVGRQWTLVTDRGRWAVRTLENWYPIVDVETEVALQLAGAAEGILLPVPVRSRSGAIVESIEGQNWRVNQWLHSGPPLVAPVGSVITRTVGGILATIHRLGLPVDRVSPWHASRLSDLAWDDLVAKAEAQGAGWASVLARAVPTLVGLESIGAGAPVPPPVLCHNNLGPGNARLGPGGQLVVVGWEHAGGQPPGWELADALMHWTIDPDGRVNTVGARAMVEGYVSEAGSLPPLDLGMFRGAIISLVNYVSGEIDQALAARDEEDQRDANRSVRHLLTHLPSRANLEQLLAVALATART